ncbi:uncharacterized protein EDB91DRAFT_571371 [Suillus paluster]|uniref:uncharacterized protein n=1 Tax=Suillus paluster TaxID=48578 RepID=UPI001B88715C|nr:uncharacterized protein EDB91DRAFT_571371 [Suillus paluster]KAG1735152.1 hypothetical protein EDB91DRAFT_571371 [Suillus paluster]
MANTHSIMSRPRWLFLVWSPAHQLSEEHALSCTSLYQIAGGSVASLVGQCRLPMTCLTFVSFARQLHHVRSPVNCLQFRLFKFTHRQLYTMLSKDKTASIVRRQLLLFSWRSYCYSALLCFATMTTCSDKDLARKCAYLPEPRPFHTLLLFIIGSLSGRAA